jgi:hypothetical protein
MFPDKSAAKQATGTADIWQRCKQQREDQYAKYIGLNIKHCRDMQPSFM